jgi:hypothetical protein
LDWKQACKTGPSLQKLEYCLYGLTKFFLSSGLFGLFVRVFCSQIDRVVIVQPFSIPFSK